MPFEIAKELSPTVPESEKPTWGIPIGEHPTLKKGYETLAELATPPKDVAGKVGQVAGQVGTLELLPDSAVKELIPGEGTAARAARGARTGPDSPYCGS